MLFVLTSPVWKAPRYGRSVLVKGVLLVCGALVLAAVVSQQSAAPAATASTTSLTSVATTELDYKCGDLQHNTEDTCNAAAKCTWCSSDIVTSGCYTIANAKTYGPNTIQCTKTPPWYHADTTELFRGREIPKCGPNDDACCDQFSPSVTRHKGGGYNMGRCVQAGCSGSPVFNFHPAPGRPLPSFDGGQFPQGHCVPKHYRPKPGDANSPARAKREAATTSLGSDDTTELRGMKCGPTDDACCDQFSSSSHKQKGGGWRVGDICIDAGCSGTPVFNMHPVPGGSLPNFDGIQFPQGHCVPTHYAPKPGDAHTPAEALKRRPHTTSLSSDDTTELFRGRVVKCGPTDDACCDQFSPSVGRVKGGGWKVGDNCVNAGCSAAPVFNYHPVPGRPLPHFDGIQFPQGHCVPTHYSPKPGDSRKPAFAKREAATTSLSYTRYVGTDCHKTKHGHLRCKGKKKVRCHKTSHGNTRCH